MAHSHATTHHTEHMGARNASSKILIYQEQYYHPKISNTHSGQLSLVKLSVNAVQLRHAEQAPVAEGAILGELSGVLAGQMSIIWRKYRMSGNYE
jgi:hypothetical protein